MNAEMLRPAGLELRTFKAPKQVFGPKLEILIRPDSLDRQVPRTEVLNSVVTVSSQREHRAAILKTPEPQITPDVLKNFTATQEVESLRKKFNDGLAQGTGREEVINRIVAENSANMRAYQWEYTMSDPILVNPVKQNKNGELVNSKSEYSILEMTSKNEREGAVWESVVKTQALLKEARVGESVMIISPAGWSGRVDAQGKEIVYPEAEIFAFIKGEGSKIRALTFVADLNMQQCEEFRAAFLKPEPQTEQKKFNEKEKIIKMTASPILVSGGKIKFEDILDKIQSIKGGEIMREADGAGRTFSEARNFLARGDELQEMPELCEEVIETYEDYLRKNISEINNPAVYGAVKQRMEMTVFEIAKILRGGKNETNQISNFYMQAMNANNIQLLDTRVVDSNYNSIIHFLQTRPGCNGGGNSTSGVFSSSLSEILSGNSISISSTGGLFGSAESGATCKVCGINSAAKGGCGFCDGCAKKAA